MRNSYVFLVVLAVISPAWAEAPSPTPPPVLDQVLDDDDAPVISWGKARWHGCWIGAAGGLVVAGGLGAVGGCVAGSIVGNYSATAANRAVDWWNYEADRAADWWNSDDESHAAAPPQEEPED